MSSLQDSTRAGGPASGPDAAATRAGAGRRVELRDVTLRVGGEVALDSFSAIFEPGTVTALVGGDGAGKTTLLSTLAYPHGRTMLGISDLSPRDVGFQPASSGVWPNMSVEENLRFVATAQRIRGAQADARVDELIGIAGLEGARGRAGARLSGGMRQKLGATMAFLHRPGLLLLDEPTTGVDPESREVLASLIRGAADDGATVVVATTYLDEAERADQVILLDAGHVLAAGPAPEVVAVTPGSVWSTPAGAVDLGATSERVWQRGQSLFEWRPDASAGAREGKGEGADVGEGEGGEGGLSGAREGAGGVASSGAGELAGARRADLDLELSTVAFLLDHRGSEVDEFHVEGVAASPSSSTAPSASSSPSADAAPATPSHPDHPQAAPLISCAGVTKNFGSSRALDGVGLEVLPGQVVSLVGGNGAGKSTLIRLILGVDAPDSGHVELFGERPTRRSRARVGYVAQALGLYPALAAQENLDFTQDVFEVAKDRRTRVEADRTPVGRLPLGARRALAVTCALSHSPELLVLDEPTSGMDSLGRAELWKQIRRAAAAGVGVLVTTHYQQEAAQCDVLVRLNAGKVVATTRAVPTATAG